MTINKTKLDAFFKQCIVLLYAMERLGNNVKAETDRRSAARGFFLSSLLKLMEEKKKSLSH